MEDKRIKLPWLDFNTFFCYYRVMTRLEVELRPFLCLTLAALSLTLAGCRTGKESFDEPLTPVVPPPPAVVTGGTDRPDYFDAIRRASKLEMPIPPPSLTAPRLTPSLYMSPTVPLIGRVLYLNVSGAPELELSGHLAGYQTRFQKGKDSYWALVGLDPWVKPGTYPLEINSVDLQGNRGHSSVQVNVAGVNYPAENIDLPASVGGPLSVVSQAEFDQVEKLIRRFSPEKLWEGTFQMPVAGVTSSVFGARRSYGHGSIISQHTGWDLAAPQGELVKAPNRARVVLATSLPNRGNTVILDHGLAVHSLYLHLSRSLVQEGEMVAKGQPIGHVGATGIATGPHLHWEMRVNGATVDPTLWLYNIYGENP